MLGHLCEALRGKYAGDEIIWGMTFIFMVHLSFYANPWLIYDVMYDITTIP